jgi:hypothetical protein
LQVDYSARPFFYFVPKNIFKYSFYSIFTPGGPVWKGVLALQLCSIKNPNGFDSVGFYLTTALMETGPNLLKLLMDIFIRFRCHKVALTADIEKALLHIRIVEEDRDLFPFIWVENRKKIQNSNLTRDSIVAFLGLLFSTNPARRASLSILKTGPSSRIGRVDLE